ncbi:beta family protein [Pectobacterium polaris]|uniref:beta family protein n=1 Tax=Pectobacterium polaris TaxID=2042057 RepID=UPI0019694AFD|nr:beta family protein [Pectobacterium polaris]MBN3216401.1 beta family protein [Pectobacterium polaris]
MQPKYIPILKAKKGEFEAIDNLQSNHQVMKHMLPIFEIPILTKKQRKSKKYAEVKNPVEFFLNNCALSLSESMRGHDMGLDISRWAPNSSIESGEHVLSHLIGALAKYSGNIIPVVGYDRWEDDEYSTTLKVISQSQSEFIIRLNSFAFEDMIEEDPFFETLDDIISSLDLMPEQCSVLLDFEDVTKVSIVDLNEKLQRAISALTHYNFKFLTIAGSSIAGDINGMVPEKNSQGIVIRKEVKVWKAFKKFHPSLNLIFGDYGIVSPTVSDEIISPNANGKIRYTIDDSLFVVRGYSRATGKKGSQMQDLSKVLVSTSHYKGREFSWGDKMIDECANEKFVGSTTNWVSIDTTHHATHVVSEIREFEFGIQHQREFQN